MALPRLPVRTGRTSLIDISQIEGLGKKFRLLAVAIPGFEKVKPEFGAYMSYSIVLERGATFTKVSRPYSLRGRPHILPSVEQTSGFIVNGVLKDGMVIMKRLWDGKGHSVVRPAVEKMWDRILNDKPRRRAVEMTAEQKIYEFGFHRRSIRGHGKPPRDAEVRALQMREMEKRKALARNKRKKN